MGFYYRTCDGTTVLVKANGFTEANDKFSTLGLHNIEIMGTIICPFLDDGYDFVVE